MKILIVTAWYHPFIHPRAHRWTALAEHWAAQGHEVHVVSARRRDCPNEAVVNGVHVHRTGFDSLKEVFYYWFGSKNGRGRVGVAAQKPGVFTRLATWLYNAFWKKIYFPDDACLWYFPAKKKTGQLLAQGQFDALITVSLPFTGHLIGRRLRNFESFVNVKATPATTQHRGRNIIWLADIGDPFSIQAKSLNNAFFYGNLSRRLERQVLESADVVTVTTEFTLKKYREQFGEKTVVNMHVIPPLLHPAPFDPAPDPSPTGRGDVKRSVEDTTEYVAAYSASPLPVGEGSGVGLKLGYFGALYVPVRTPDAFLDLLGKMFSIRPDLREHMEVHFYGEIFSEFFKKLAAQPAIRLHGLCPRATAQAAMREMDILVNIGNTTGFQLPSKAVEYLATGKPILNLSYSDDDPFAAFFADNSLIFNLKIINGKVEEEGVRRWLEWLETEKKLPYETGLEAAIAPYRVEAVADCYLALLQKINHPVLGSRDCPSGAEYW